jgi:hypothetical protein
MRRSPALTWRKAAAAGAAQHRPTPLPRARHGEQTESPIQDFCVCHVGILAQLPALPPLAQQSLGRDGTHLAALGLSLHLHQAVPAARQRFGSAI